MRWAKGWIDSDVLWSGSGLSIGWAFNIRCSIASPSNSALPAELYLSWLSSSYSSLCLWLSHLARKMQPKPALSLREEKGIPHVSLLLIKCHFLLSEMMSIIGRQAWSMLLKKARQAVISLPLLMRAESHFDSLQLFHQLPSFITQLGIMCWRRSTMPWPGFIFKRHQCYMSVDAVAYDQRANIWDDLLLNVCWTIK